MALRKRTADTYLLDVKYKHKRIEGVTLDKDSFGTNVGDAIPLLQNQQLTEQLAQLAQSIQLLQTSLDTRLNSIECRLSNSVAHEMEDTIVPPQAGAVAPPANFPRTIGALINISANRLVSVEQYYGLVHELNATRTSRISKVRKAYGTGIIIR